jgi:hypothetical protein
VKSSENGPSFDMGKMKNSKKDEKEEDDDDKKSKKEIKEEKEELKKEAKKDYKEEKKDQKSWKESKEEKEKKEINEVKEEKSGSSSSETATKTVTSSSSSGGGAPQKAILDLKSKTEQSSYWGKSWLGEKHVNLESKTGFHNARMKYGKDFWITTKFPKEQMYQVSQLILKKRGDATKTTN